MASHHLIDTHLAALARHLPGDAVDELADGLHETWHHHLAAGLPPDDAARAAVAEFGDTDQITHAYVTNCPGRRIARMLLTTGPLVGASWGASLVAAHAWDWPIPGPSSVVFGATLLAVVGLLVTAATSRHSYRRARLGIAGGVGLIVLDTTMLAAVVLAAPTLVWPMLVAVPVSLARIGLTLRGLPARTP